MKKISQYKLTILLIGLGLLLRLYNFPQYYFGFDQVQILQNSQRILQLDPTLIGPQTGPADMYTGPLIYYLNALSLLITNSPYSLVITTTILSLLTAISLFYLSQKYLDKTFSQIILLFWATSPILIHLDRTPWNPNLILLAASFSFFPLLKNKSLHRPDLAHLALGAFLGYQAHFSGLLLPPLILTTLFIQKRLDFKSISIIILAFFASLTPTIIFDLRNNFLNTKGLFALLGNSQQVSLAHSLFNFFKVLKTNIESLGFLAFESNHSSLIITSAIAILFLYTFTKSNNHHKKTLFTWSSLIILSFSLYRRSTPEYYFLIQYPAFLFLTASVFHQLWHQNFTFTNPTKPKNIFNTLLKSKTTIPFSALIILFLTIYSTLNTQTKYSKPGNHSIATLLKAKHSIQQLSQKIPVKSFIYDTELVYSEGLKFLLKDLPENENGQDYHIIYPYAPKNLSTLQYGPDSVIWIDPRTNLDKFYLSTGQFILESPLDTQILQDLTHKPHNSTYSFYITTANSQPLGRIYVISEERYLPEMARTNTNPPENDWLQVIINDKPHYYQPKNHLHFIYFPLNPTFSPEDIKILN